MKKLSKKSCTKLLKSKNLCFPIGMHPNYLGKETNKKAAPTHIVLLFHTTRIKVGRNNTSTSGSVISKHGKSENEPENKIFNILKENSLV